MLQNDLLVLQNTDKGMCTGDQQLPVDIKMLVEKETETEVF